MENRNTEKAVREIARWLVHFIEWEDDRLDRSEPASCHYDIAREIVEDAEENPGWQNGWLRVECPARYTFDRCPRTTDVEAVA